MSWIVDNLGLIGSLSLEHLRQSILPIVIGFALSVPIGWLAFRFRLGRGVILTVTGLLYTIPSLALFILMPLVIGTGILDPINVIVALTIYTVALLVRTVADGLGAVPEQVLQAATAMGIGRVRRFFTVELPLAVPVISAGLRVAAVSNVSIVSVAALLGISQLGSLFTDGFARDFLDPIIVGIVASIALAVLFDVVILGLGRAATPWLRGRTA